MLKNNPFEKIVKPSEEQKVIMVDLDDLEFLRKIKSIDYESIKAINPNWKGLLTELHQKAYNPITGETKEIVEKVNVVNKFQFIDVLIECVKKLDLELKTVKQESADEIKVLKDLVLKLDQKVDEIEARQNEHKIMNDQKAFLFKERLDRITDISYVYIQNDLTSSQYVFPTVPVTETK